MPVEATAWPAPPLLNYPLDPIPQTIAGLCVPAHSPPSRPAADNITNLPDDPHSSSRRPRPNANVPGNGTGDNWQNKCLGTLRHEPHTGQPAPGPRIRQHKPLDGPPLRMRSCGSVKAKMEDYIPVQTGTQGPKRRYPRTFWPLSRLSPPRTTIRSPGTMAPRTSTRFPSSDPVSTAIRVATCFLSTLNI